MLGSMKRQDLFNHMIVLTSLFDLIQRVHTNFKNDRTELFNSDLVSTLISLLEIQSRKVGLVLEFRLLRSLTYPVLSSKEDISSWNKISATTQ